MKTKNVFLIVVALFTGIATFSQNLEEGLVAYYPFSGNADDASGNGYNGLITGATFTDDHNGTPNSAISFADASQNVDLLNTDAFSFGQGSFSISYWFNTSASNVYMAAFINGCGAWAPGIVCGLNWDMGRIIFGVGADGSFNTANCIGICTSDDSWLDGQWHHVVSIVNKETNRAMIYVDGEKQALVKYNVFGVTGGTFVNNDTELDITGVDYLADASETTSLIGNSMYGQFFNGAIDEFRVYERA
ncbi:MAG: LamG domain-containing protein, partial [Bacteroidales bacterium]|nr:LamG domain-containing protein [Bacteroidales bacterium]